MTQTSPLLEMRGIDKSYPGVQVLTDIGLEAHAGRVLALLGANGAGKSTLMKILCGAVAPDRGTIQLYGQQVRLKSPNDAIRRGIGIIHQEFQLIPTLRVYENVFLGKDKPWIWVDRSSQIAQTEQLLESLGANLSPNALVKSLSIAQQQMVEIAKALSNDIKVLIMDEPTASLSLAESERLLGLIRQLAKLGIAIVFISHRLEEVFQVADDIQVLRDGKSVYRAAAQETNRDQLIRVMVGNEADEFEADSNTNSQAAEVILRVEGLGRKKIVRDASLTLRAGEILGITGLVGAGRSEWMRLLSGADLADCGTITLDGRRLKFRNPADAIRAGIVLLSEDRKNEGLILQHSLLDNYSLPNLKKFSGWGWLRNRRRTHAFAKQVEQLRIKASGPFVPARTLSGGNQQKVVLSKWLERDARVFIFDEPTRGIDIGAKREIYSWIQSLAARGKGILVVSSEFPEVLALSHRILVMSQGAVVKEFTDPTRTTPHDLLAAALPVTSPLSNAP